MEAIKLHPYQIKALDAIQGALDRGQKHIAIEIPTGLGKGIIFAKTVEILNKLATGKILVVARSLIIKEELEKELSTNHQGFLQIYKDNIVVETVKNLVKYYNEKWCEYQYVIFYDVLMSPEEYETLPWKEKTVIAFNTINSETLHRRFLPIETVFSYSLKDAANDGLFAHAMHECALELYVEKFTEQLLKQFGYVQISSQQNKQDQEWDLIVNKDEQKIWVECKSFKNQVVSPSAANSMLNTVVMRKMKQDIPQKDLILLVVFSKIPSFQKDEIFERYGIVVWEIENLVFYSKNNPNLLKQLSKITYYPIDYIEGQISEEAELAGLFLICGDDKPVDDAYIEAEEIDRLIRQLDDCEPGKEHSRQYEEVCELIIRNLFEANYFNRLTSQHKTEDEHFRMDLIGSLKINQNNEESMHPLWQMFVQHYNSHFVVFEFKNYSKEIDQNLIYITEKYLFSAALRNVAIIISRKGFSKSAKFAAEGCLKEHGKLILGITDKDLVEMLKLKSDEAADYLLGKLEDFLMGISK